MLFITIRFIQTTQVVHDFCPGCNGTVGVLVYTNLELISNIMFCA